MSRFVGEHDGCGQKGPPLGGQEFDGSSECRGRNSHDVVQGDGARVLKSVLRTDGHFTVEALDRGGDLGRR